MLLSGGAAAQSQTQELFVADILADLAFAAAPEGGPHHRHQQLRIDPQQVDEHKGQGVFITQRQQQMCI